MALQIAALNDEPFIFVILRTLQLSRYGTLVVQAAPITPCPIALLELQSVERTQRKPR